MIGIFDFHMCLQPIRSNEADRRFWSQQIQVRPDLIFQQLPQLGITEQLQASCQLSRNEQCCREPLGWVARADSSRLLLYEFSDRQLKPLAK